MAKAATRVLTAHVHGSLAEQVDQAADRSRGWIVKQALLRWIAQEEVRDRLTHEALTDVDADRVLGQPTGRAEVDRQSEH